MYLYTYTEQKKKKRKTEKTRNLNIKPDRCITHPLIFPQMLHMDMETVLFISAHGHITT